MRHVRLSRRRRSGRPGPGCARLTLADGARSHTLPGDGRGNSSPRRVAARVLRRRWQLSRQPVDSRSPTYSVTATVFYDENGNGLLDTSEIVRVPNVTVTIGTGTGTSAPTTGQAAVTGIQEGSFAPQVRTESLPAYFEPPVVPLPPVTVPGGTTAIRIPLTLPVGGNRKNRYFGYGDSITAGDGSSDGQGYALKLQSLLAPHFGYAEVVEVRPVGHEQRPGARARSARGCGPTAPRT